MELKSPKRFCCKLISFSMKIQAPNDKCFGWSRERPKWTRFNRTDEITRSAVDNVSGNNASLTADPGVASSTPAWTHTFAEIDREIISTVIQDYK